MANSVVSQTAKVRRVDWPASSWEQIKDGELRLFAVMSEAGVGLDLELSTRAPGAALEVLLDGKLVAIEALPAGAATVTVATSVAAGPHLLVLVPVAGRVAPGPVRLVS